MTARAWSRALGAARRTLCGRAASASASARRETRRRDDDDERRDARRDDGRDAIDADEMYARLCARDGDDGRARAMDGMLAALEASAGEDAAAIRRLAFALEGSGGDGGRARGGGGGGRGGRFRRERGSGYERGAGCGSVANGAATTRASATADDGEEASRRVPGLRHGAVFGLDRAAVDEGDETTTTTTTATTTSTVS